jgi:hypothetical protein
MKGETEDNPDDYDIDCKANKRLGEEDNYGIRHNFEESKVQVCNLLGLFL